MPIVDNMRAQDEKFGVEMVDYDIVEVNLAGPVKLLTGSAGAVHRVKTMTEATCSGYRAPGAARGPVVRSGVSWCATCDGFFFVTRTLSWSRRWHRHGGATFPPASPVRPPSSTTAPLCERRRSCKTRLRVRQGLLRQRIAEIEEKDGVLAGVALRDVLPGATVRPDVTCVFIAIGHTPRTEFSRSARFRQQRIPEGRLALDPHEHC
ncbi:hypothetical protein O1W17_39790 [Streptomyces sp. H34-S5]|nr:MULTISPECIES: hypothetical protein [unclassified Streptomyces]MCY0947072.1 hypothetical protein [Streptomyces sp. H34-AA3]MCZ4088027.1 hypothetical protein [Streptomyces sp. H34-S5]